jgi:hypothetical protein
MKKIYSIIAGLLLTVSVFAQAPQKMSYQAVIRNSSNALLTSTAVGMKISILQSSSTGAAVYVETQTPSTNSNGLVSLEIGTGTIITGTFSGINWAAGPYFIKTETDPTGGTDYTIAGTNELMSVPYALFSANGTAGSIGAAGPNIITVATKTTQTGLLTGNGANVSAVPATTASIAASADKNYVTNDQQTVLGNTSNTNTGDQTTITGNAGTSTALATARTINGVPFDGTANITITAAAGGIQYFEKELVSDGENSIAVTFSLGAFSKIYYNGALLKQNQWSGVGLTTLTLILDTRQNDKLTVTN